MDVIVKQCVGIDISASTFEVCFKEEGQQGSVKIKGTRRFDNTPKGFKAYLEWCTKRKKNCSVVHVVEATGVYHENLCYYLYENCQDVSVQLPQKVKYFIKSTNQKTKTDKQDAKAIADLGLALKLELWQPLSKGFKDIRDLCRTLSKLKQGKRVTQCQIHAIGQLIKPIRMGYRSWKNFSKSIPI